MKVLDQDPIYAANLGAHNQCRTHLPGRSIQLEMEPYFQTPIRFYVLRTLFRFNSSAMLGMLIGRLLPEHHLTDQTKGVINVATGMIGTLTAFFLGLLIAAASSSFSTRNQEVVNIAADVIQMDHLLRRYGPETGGVT